MAVKQFSKPKAHGVLGAAGVLYVVFVVLFIRSFLSKVLFVGHIFTKVHYSDCVPHL